MGVVKQEMLEAEERGWYVPEGSVCDRCVEDEYLKGLIRQNVSQSTCDFCGRKSHSYCAAPVAILMEPIGNTVMYYFNEPTRAGVPYDRGFVVEPLGTRDILKVLSLHCNNQLFEVVSDAFFHDSWVSSAGGQWASTHQNEVLRISWSNFVNVVKHDVRFFFSRLPTSNLGHDEYTPQQLLSIISNIVQELGLVSTLTVGTSLFRVRERDNKSDWELNQEQMGPAPSNRAAAGRMNPAGISYLYLAFDQETALAEVLERPPCGAAIAQFDAQRDLVVLDLTALPILPSIFDDSRREEREGLLFLKQFVVEISKPVRKDGSEHIEYVPSQVVSEYLALVFRANGLYLDGIVYPSALRFGGKNIVLFPNKRGVGRNFNQVLFRSSWELKIADWAEFTTAIDSSRNNHLTEPKARRGSR